jgi:hypothetical protein
VGRSGEDSASSTSMLGRGVGVRGGAGGGVGGGAGGGAVPRIDERTSSQGRGGEGSGSQGGMAIDMVDDPNVLLLELQKRLCLLDVFFRL